MFLCYHRLYGPFFFQIYLLKCVFRICLLGFMISLNVTSPILGVVEKPVPIVNNCFDVDWSRFDRNHAWSPNLTIVFGVERKWIFEIFVLDDNHNQVVYPWTNSTQGFSNLYPRPNSRCICFTFIIVCNKLNICIVVIISFQFSFVM